MKIAISGKGGSGKTTLTALLAQAVADQGFRVFAIDADPNPNLALALNVSGTPQPLVEMKDLMEERLGALEGFFKINPHVDDIPERFSVEHNGIRLLVMGGVRKGGAGCACPENTILRSLLQHLMLLRDEWVIVDCEAGLEHLGRATAQGVDALLIVIEPNLVATETAQRIRMLAGEIGLQRLYAVGNKVRGPEDAEFIKQHLDGIELLTLLPESPAAREAARSGTPVQDSELTAHASTILRTLQAG